MQFLLLVKITNKPDRVHEALLGGLGHWLEVGDRWEVPAVPASYPLSRLQSGDEDLQGRLSLQEAPV